MVASQAGQAEAGNQVYRDEHLGKIFQEGLSFSGYERDHLYLSLGSGQFVEISGVSGMDSLTDGRGAVFADLDNDGDLDVFLTAIQGKAHLLFRNNVGSENSFVRVALEGRQSGRDAIGAIVRVKTTAGILTQVKSGGSGFLSQHDPRLVFGLGADEKADWVEVTWPSGQKQRSAEVLAGTSLKIVEEEAYTEVSESRFSLPDPLSQSEVLLTRLNIEVGSRFPDVPVASLLGEETSLRKILRPGRRYLLNLWATYCVPCASEMPELERLYPSFKRNNVEVVGLSLDRAGVGRINGFLKQRGITYPNYVASDELVAAVYANDEVFIPLSILLDGRGRVHEVFSGWSERTRARLREYGADISPRL